MTVLKAGDGATATPLAFVRPVTPQYLGQGPRQAYRLPSHISKTVLSTVKIGPLLFPAQT